MSRPLRIAIPDGVYHIMCRGTEKRDIVRDDIDRQRWYSLLARVAMKRGWRVFAWALMTNHFHLFLRTPKADLSEGMHDLNSGYVTLFNRRHERVGPLLQGRFKSILVENEHHYWELSRYIHLNPVRAGLCEAPSHYAWSSCHWYTEPLECPEWLDCATVLERFDGELAKAGDAYQRFLREGVDCPPDSPFAETVAGSLLGSTAFLADMQELLAPALPVKGVPAAHGLRREPSLQRIADAVCGAFHIPQERLRERGTHHNPARAVAARLAQEVTRASLEDIGLWLGGVKGTAVSNMVTRLRVKMRGDDGLAGIYAELLAGLKSEK
ncbi:MAG: transposase [Planctomycetota bacterium]|jgi:REP element-mobilizing transposase RayT